MARGKKVNIEEYLASLENYLKVGCSLHESCVHTGIPYRTMKDYYDKDEKVRRKIDMWGNHDIYLARRSVIGGLKLDSRLALDYLKNKKSDEFTTSTKATVEAKLMIQDVLDKCDEPEPNEIT